MQRKAFHCIVNLAVGREDRDKQTADAIGKGLGAGLYQTN